MTRQYAETDVRVRCYVGLILYKPFLGAVVSLGLSRYQLIYTNEAKSENVTGLRVKEEEFAVTVTNV